MLTRLLFVAALLAAGCWAVDHDTFKSCAEIPLCGDRREQPPQLKYEINIRGNYSNGVARFDLRGIDNEVDEIQDAVLVITAIKGGIFRVEIEEVDSTRYTLEYVLDGEPTIVDFDAIGVDPEENGGSVSLLVGTSRAEVYADPFYLEFYQNEVLQLVLPGDRLSLENTAESVAFTFGVEFPQAIRLYGLHEHADNLTLQNTSVNGTDPYRQRNLDVYMHELASPMALYGNIPVLYGHGPKATTGVFVHNAAEQWVETTHTDDGSRAFFIVGGGKLDVFVLLGPSPKEVVRQYAGLTGTATLPQLWTLGFHQSRWGYWDQDEVISVIERFDEYDLPIDVIWLDSQHTDGGRFFTWHPENFSDPIGMLDSLASTNRYTVTISDPHVYKDPGYFVYAEALKGDLFVRYANGTLFEGEVWPPVVNFFDYFNPATREYYAGLYSYDVWAATPALGGIWNDMNEPSVFIDALEKTFPPEIEHYGGILHRDSHAIYGLLQIISTYQGLLQRDNNTLRPFILTRSHTAGSQRYAAIWTGDNQALWDFVNAAWSMCLNANILGISFCGADIGGFENDPSDEMLQRFFQTGAWLPFFRVHSNQYTRHREPYLYPDVVRNVLKDAMRLRYMHVPVFYTAFYEHTLTGDPVIRPLFYAYPSDTELVDIDDQLLLGDNILAKQIFEEGVTEVEVYFPGGEEQKWYSVYEDASIISGTGFQTIPVTIAQSPVYYRGGSIIPIKETPRRSTTDMIDDPYTLIVVPDDKGRASGTLFVDDYRSFNYIEKSEYNYVGLEAVGDLIALLPVTGSNRDNFPIKVERIIHLLPERDEDGELTGKYIKKESELTRDGDLLVSLVFGRDPMTVELSL